MIYADILYIMMLLGIFQIKHFIADFPLQGQYMLGKMKREGWFLPLFAHASVHAGFTLSIMLLFAPGLWWLSLVDLVIHFTVDRLKASPDIGGRFSPNEPYFWWALGADQMAHHFTHYAFIYLMVLN